MSGVRLRRSAHFVPSANEKMLAKSLATAADSLVLDLEDAVTPERKDEARAVVAGWLATVDFAGKERIVRLNPLETPWGRADVAATMVHPPDAYLVPKIRTLDDVLLLDAEIAAREREHGHAPGGVKLILVATETPQGVLNLPTFTRCQRVNALTWGAEDLSAAIGARRSRDEHGDYLEVFRHCRLQTLLCAAAAGVQPLDTAFVDIRNLEGLRRDCRDAAWMGFTGKITIHPDHVPIVNEMFSPSPEEAAEALELVAAFEAAQREGRMAFQFRGAMVDMPHLTRARTIVAQARAAGVIPTPGAGH
ncbi:MAG: CoA ester lyase [Deltaproteobacteria bacterium]|nr:CoA ester lyase [Deltaproteobacteria bacterium]